MQTFQFKAADRGRKDAGWLKSNFYFSFSDYCNPVKSSFGTLITFNDDYIEPGKGFGIHPHVNMEIISILLAGKMNHKDTMGYSTVVEPGGVQIMSAGSGLKHEEYNIGEDRVNFLQIWIQPKQQNISPRYQQRQFDIFKSANKLQTIVSFEEGLGHCWINQNAKLSVGNFESGCSLQYAFSPVNKCVFVFVIKGSCSVAGVELPERDALGIWETDNLTIECKTDAQFLIIETPVNQK